MAKGADDRFVLEVLFDRRNAERVGDAGRAAEPNADGCGALRVSMDRQQLIALVLVALMIFSSVAYAVSLL